VLVVRQMCVLSVLAALVFPCSLAWADDAAGWSEGGETSASPEDFIPKLSDEEAYSERYTFSVDLDGGGWIGTNLTISNLGLGNGHAAARVRVQLPNRKKEYSYNKKVSSGDWTSEPDRLDLRVAGVELAAKDANGFTIRFADPDSDVKVELDFKNDLPMWHPGNGRIDVDKGYVKYGMLAPRATVKGRVFIDGAWTEITSTRKAFGDRSASNIAPYNFAKRFARFRVFDKDLTVMWREHKLVSELGDRSMTWLMIGYKGKVVFSDANASLRMGKKVRDSKTDYVIPYAVQVDGKSGKDSAKMVMRAKKMDRQDLLESYGSAAKLVAGAVSKPFRYDFPCKFTVQMDIGGVKATVQGKGRYSFDMVNP